MMLATAVLAATFNLVCTGPSYDMAAGEFPKANNKATFETIYRVDLKSGRWCSGACLETKALFSVTQTRITFEDIKEPLEIFTTVNRESGEHTAIVKSDFRTLYNGGQCVRADFTGFPTFKF